MRARQLHQNVRLVPNEFMSIYPARSGDCKADLTAGDKLRSSRTVSLPVMAEDRHRRLPSAARQCRVCIVRWCIVCRVSIHVKYLHHFPSRTPGCPCPASMPEDPALIDNPQALNAQAEAQRVGAVRGAHSAPLLPSKQQHACACVPRPPRASSLVAGRLLSLCPQSIAFIGLPRGRGGTCEIADCSCCDTEADAPGA